MQALAGFASGVLFAIGLALGGMTQPGKVIGFLDVAGAWDPTLAFVMAGAVGTFGPLYQLISRYASPRFAAAFGVKDGLPEIKALATHWEMNPFKDKIFARSDELSTGAVHGDNTIFKCAAISHG